MMRRRGPIDLRLLLVTVALWLLMPAAHALCVTPLCSCNVSSAGVAFGNYQPLSASANTATGSVHVSCGGVAGLLIPYRIDLGSGSGSIGSRRLQGPSTTLSYNLYRDASHSTVWGDGSGSSQYATGSVLLDVLGWSPTQSTTIYGRMPGSQQAATPGSYADTIGMTLTFY